MMDYNVDGDGVATITWNVSNRPMNVMNNDTMAAFGAAADKAIDDEAVKGVIVASAHKEFMVGADLSVMGDGDLSMLQEFMEIVRGNFRRMETGGKPFVAAINGHALGGGFEMCLACHHRIAANNPKTKIGLPEAKIGLLPGGGGTQRLPRMIGMQQALPLMLEGKELAPAAAKNMGLVDEVVPADDLLAAAKEFPH